MIRREDKEYYVEISTNPRGKALVSVAVASDNPEVTRIAFTLYDDTVKVLEDNDYPVAHPSDVEVKITNENSQFAPQVSVTGDGITAVEEFFETVKKVQTNSVADSGIS